MFNSLGGTNVLQSKMETYKELGCRINSMSVVDLFKHYDQVGFLYPQKRAKIAPFLPLILKNWESAFKAGEEILWIMSHEEERSGQLATLAVWRTTMNGAFSQHCTSTGNAVHSRAVVLGTQSKVWFEKKFITSQNWFREANKYAYKVFGTIDRSIHKDDATVKPYNYLAVKADTVEPQSGSAIAVPCERGRDGIYDLASRLRGRLYADGEELGSDDLGLEALDEIYRSVGLSRRRFVWLAFCPPYSEPVGAAIAYRGPLGLNLSLLENRCDLLVDSRLDDQDFVSVCKALMKSGAVAYADFPLGYIPVVADDRCAGILTCCGATLIRQYSQSIWSRRGMPAWYHHVRNIFRPVERRMQRRIRKKDKTKVHSVVSQSACRKHETPFQITHNAYHSQQWLSKRSLTTPRKEFQDDLHVSL